jgi:hypothetical protein
MDRGVPSSDLNLFSILVAYQHQYYTHSFLKVYHYLLNPLSVIAVFCLPQHWKYVETVFVNWDVDVTNVHRGFPYRSHVLLLYCVMLRFCCVCFPSHNVDRLLEAAAKSGNAHF